MFRRVLAGTAEDWTIIFATSQDGCRRVGQFSFDGDRDKYGDYLFTNGTLDAQASLRASPMMMTKFGRASAAVR